MISATEYRRRQKLTMHDCASVAGVTERTWLNWEHGRVKKMRPPEIKLRPLIENAARHFYDGMIQSDLEGFV